MNIRSRRTTRVLYILRDGLGVITAIKTAGFEGLVFCFYVITDVGKGVLAGSIVATIAQKFMMIAALEWEMHRRY